MTEAFCVACDDCGVELDDRSPQNPAHDHFHRLFRRESTCHQGFQFFLVHAADGGFVGHLGFGMKHPHDGDRTGLRLALHDFHAIHVTAGSSCMGFGDAGDFRAGFAIEHHARLN